MTPRDDFVACQIHDAKGKPVGPVVDVVAGLHLMRDRPSGWTLRRVSDGATLAHRHSSTHYAGVVAE